MSATVQIGLTIFGQKVTGIAIPVGSTVQWNLAIEDPVTRAAFDLTGASVVMALSTLDAKGHPRGTPLFSRQATITAPSSAGLCVVNWVAADTSPVSGAILPGNYGLEVWLTDASGNRLQALGFAVIELVAAAFTPTSSITPLPAQLPLAQGDPGFPVYVKNNGGSALPREAVLNLKPRLVATNNAGVATDIDLAATGVTPGSYGDAANVLAGTVDAYGRLTAASGVAIIVPQTLSSIGSSGSPLALRGLSGAASKPSAIVSGYYGANDGGGGTFIWDASSTATDDGGTIVQPTGVGTGRWRRLFSGPLNVRWFGAKGDNSTDDALAFNACRDAAIASTAEIYVPAGTYKIDGDFVHNDFLGFRGAGQTKTFLNFTPGHSLIFSRSLPNEPDYSEICSFTVNFSGYVPAWQANHHYSVGDRVTNTLRYGAFTQFVQVCRVAGNSGNTEPSWPSRQEPDGLDGCIVVPSQLPAPVSDGGVTWQSYSAPGIFIRAVTYVHNVAVFGASGDGIFISGSDNSNVSKLEDLNVQSNLGRGIYVGGNGNSQVIKVETATLQGNYSGGLSDDSQVGNTYISCVAESNGINNWQAGNGAANYAIVPGSVTVPSNLWIDANTTLLSDAVPLLQITAGFAGTLGGVEPSWTLTVGDVFVDNPGPNQVTWKVVGLCKTGQSFKTRADSLNRSMFIGCYIENDQRLAELGTSFWLGDIGDSFTHDSKYIVLDPSKVYSALQWTTRVNQAIHPLSAHFGSRDSIERAVLGWGKGNTDTHEYGLALSSDGKKWDVKTAAKTAFRLTTETDALGEGRLIHGNAELLVDDGNPGLPFSLGPVNSDNSQYPTAASGVVGDWKINRGQAAGVPQIWVCTKSAPGAIWKEFTFDGSYFFEQPSISPTDITTAPSLFLTHFGTVWGDANWAIGTTPIIINLPDPTAQATPTGLKFRFWTQFANSGGNPRLRIAAQSGQRIRLGSSRSSAGGYVQTVEAGAWLTLESIGVGTDAEWITTAVVGNWTTA